MMVAGRWHARLVFSALLLVFSELVVWQTPTTYGPLDWAALAAIYLALAALMLDLTVRLQVDDLFSALLLAGVYGLLNGTLISHVTARDLPLSLIVRPLGAQPLAFLGALGAFRVLNGGRPLRLPHLAIAAVGGLLWGVWVRWFPVTSEIAIPEVSSDTALAVTGLALAACLPLAFLAPRAPLTGRADWLLTPLDALLSGSVLLVTLVIGRAQGHLTDAALAIVLALIVFMLGTLAASLSLRGEATALKPLTPPRAPVPAAWLALAVAFLIAGALGYALPGEGDSAPQSTLLIGALTGFGIAWLPVVSAAIGVRAFAQLAREQR